MGKICVLVRLASIAAFCLVTLNFSSAQTFKTLVTFNGTDGASPGYGSLTQATNGMLVGTTIYGGDLYGGNSGCPSPYGCGTVFAMTAGGQLFTVDSFAPNGGPGVPSNGLFQASDGNFYGTSAVGGANDCGTVFMVSANGLLTTLYSFSCDANGGNPQGGLVQATNGFLYGTTSSSGAYGSGTVFRMTTGGALTTVYSFCPGGSSNGCPDGATPTVSLIQASDGNLYGTTLNGGWIMGTVFKMTLAGNLSTIYTFCSLGHCLDGNTPRSALIEGPDGSLYGTSVGGGQIGAGSVYRITTDGQFSTVFNFSGSDGGQPSGALVYASDGNFYGTTQGGWTNAGTAFRLTPSGTMKILHAFCSQQNCADGQSPYAGLTQHTDGTLYGTTYQGGDLNCSTGTSGCGTVFRIYEGLPPFVEPTPNLGRTGAAVTILGTGMTGATAVTFNGTTAQFAVVSSGAIKAVVPSGATTGKIQVTLPSRTVSSILNFTVR